MNTLFILNRQSEIVAELSNDGSSACPYRNALDHEKNNDAYRTFEFSVPTSHPDSEYIQVNNRVVKKDVGGNLIEFIIIEVEETEELDGKYKDVYCRSGHLELLGYPVRPVTLNAVTIEQALNSFLQGTRWNIGIMEWSGVKNIVIDKYMNAIEAIHLLRDEFQAELVFRVEFTGPRISKRVVDFLQKRGENRGKIIEYTKDMKHLVRLESIDPTVTGLIGVGKADSKGKYLTFKDVSAPDKPLGQDWIGNDDALEQFGIDGQHYILPYYVDEEGLTAADLLAKTRMKLAEITKPQLSYKVGLADLERLEGFEHEKIRIGDTLVVRDYTFNPPVLVEARVLELKRSDTDPEEDEAIIGNFRPLKTDLFMELQKYQQTLLKEQETWRAGVQMFSGATPPEDTSVLWNDTSQTEVPFDVLKKHDSTDWQPLSATVASQIGGVDNGTGQYYLLDANGEVATDINPERVGFKEVATDLVIAPNVVTSMTDDEDAAGGYNLYVDPVDGNDSNDGRAWTNAKRTVQAAIDAVPKYLKGTVKIFLHNINGNSGLTEKLQIYGFIGDGSLTIDFQNYSNKLNGDITIKGCSARVVLETVVVNNSDAGGGLVTIHNSAEVNMNQCKLFTRGLADYGVYAQTSYVRLNNCEINDSLTAAIAATYGGFADVINCTGKNNKISLYTYYTGGIAGTGTCPGYSQTWKSSAFGNTTYQITGNWTDPSAGSSTTAPPAPVEVKKTYSAAAGDTYRSTVYVGWQNDSYVTQGNYGYGLNWGYWFFGAITAPQGKTISRIRVYLKRASTGGSSGNVTAYIRPHTYTSEPAGAPASPSSTNHAVDFKWGEGKWITLPSSFHAGFQYGGTSNGIMIYTSNTSKAYYTKFFKSAKIEITYS